MSDVSRQPDASRTLAAAALLGGLGVAAGAFGAHALRDHLDAAELAIYETAVRYQVWHALALLGCAALQRSGLALVWATRAFVLGSMLFCGSLYVLVGTGVRWLGAVTPFGGVLLLLGWLGLLRAALVQARSSRRDPPAQPR